MTLTTIRLVTGGGVCRYVKVIMDIYCTIWSVIIGQTVTQVITLTGRSYRLKDRAAKQPGGPKSSEKSTNPAAEACQGKSQ